MVERVVWWCWRGVAAPPGSVRVDKALAGEGIKWRHRRWCWVCCTLGGAVFLGRRNDAGREARPGSVVMYCSRTVRADYTGGGCGGGEGGRAAAPRTCSPIDLQARRARSGKWS